MKVDPNHPVNSSVEQVLIEADRILLADGSSCSLQELDKAENPFVGFCKSLDPNLCFISALIPDDAGRELFFKARTLAETAGIHMQAPVDTPDRLRRTWDRYCISVRHRVQEEQKEKAAASENAANEES